MTFGSVFCVISVWISIDLSVGLKPTPEGLFPAVFTPLDEEGNLNLKVIPNYAKYLEVNRIDGVLVSGTSGEGPSLSLIEKKELLDAWLKSAKPLGMKVAMQVGGMPLPEVLEMAKYAEIAGADAIITLPELYFKPKTVEDTVAYVKQVAEAAPSLPTLYYDHPSYSGVNLNLGKFFKLATNTIPTFKGVKCSFSAALQITSSNNLNEDQTLFIKSPLEIAPGALMGFNSSMAGGISIFPKTVIEIQRAIADSDVVRAKELQTTLNKRMGVILAQGDAIAAQKAALQLIIGIKVGNVRYPISSLLLEERQLICKNLVQTDTDLHGFKMPKVTVGRKYCKAYTEEDVEKALQAIKNGMGKKTAANKFNIPRATLQFRLSNQFVKSRPGPDTVLTSAEEKEIVKWIITACRKGFPRRKEDIIKSVKLYLDEHPRPNSFIDNTPGEGWYKLFLKRHPELAIRTSEAVTSASSKLSEKQIRNWFRQVEEYLKENDLFHILSEPSRVYNGDETNFILCPKNTKVIALKGTKNVYEVDHAQSKSCVTVMFTFSADGVTTPPMIIYPLKRMRPEIQKSVPSEWGIGLSDNGWMKAELFIQYIQNVLHPALIKRNITFPVILFLDGHKSHTTLQLTQLCQNLGIILIALYPNATRILQPADVAAFRPIKVMWRKAVLEWRTDNLTKSLLKTDVAPILEKLLPRLNKTTLKNGFEACGLCPFNPEQVDYTKCLMPSNTIQDVLDDNCSTSLNYQTFQEIVGPQLIRKMKNQVVGKSIEAKKLHELYKYLVPKTSTQGSSSQIIQTTSTELTEHKDRSNLNEQNNDSSEDLNTMAALNEFTTMSTEVELLLNGPKQLSTHQSQSKDTGASKTNAMVADYSGTSGHEVIETNSPLPTCIIIPSINDSVPEAVQTVKVMSECQRESPLMTPISLTPIPSTSCQNVELIGGKWVLVDDMPTEVTPKTPMKIPNIKDFLKLPKTPIKTQKAGTEHRSFVLTSKDWEAVELEKQQKKKKEIQEKENKRKERLEKAEEKRLLKEKKQAETLNKKNKAKNVNLIKKSKPDSNSIKSKIVIHSNVVIKPANRISSDFEEEIGCTREIKKEPIKPANRISSDIEEERGCTREIKKELIKPANRISSDIEEERGCTRDFKKEPTYEVKPANITALKEIKNRPLNAVEATNVKKEFKKIPISDEDLLKMLEED